MTERLDNPNQQVVRPDASGPADEGSGAGKAPKAAPKAATGKKGTTSSEGTESREESA